MARHEDEVLEDLAYEEAEGASDFMGEDELEDEDELGLEDEGEFAFKIYRRAEAPQKAKRGPSWQMNLGILTSFSREGFQTTPRFRNSWAKLMSSGHLGAGQGFRKWFCRVKHYKVSRVVNGKRKINNIVVLGGYPIVYSLKAGQKPLLGAIAPKGWHLKHVRRSVPPPPFCMRK
jgi:hypothetical protein